MSKFIDISDRPMPKDTQYQRSILVRPSSQSRIIVNTGLVGLFAGSLGMSLARWSNIKVVANTVKYSLGGLAIGFFYFTINEMLTGMVHKNKPLLHHYYSTNLGSGLITYALILGFFVLRRPNMFMDNLLQAQKYILPVVTFGLYEDVFVAWTRRKLLSEQVKRYNTFSELIKREKQREAMIDAGLPVEDDGIVRPKKGTGNQIVEKAEYQFRFGKLKVMKSRAEKS